MLYLFYIIVNLYDFIVLSSAFLMDLNFNYLFNYLHIFTPNE